VENGISLPAPRKLHKERLGDKCGKRSVDLRHRGYYDAISIR
jgi:hypothetical protein